jgi:hypothetical protein
LVTPSVLSCGRTSFEPFRVRLAQQCAAWRPSRCATPASGDFNAESSAEPVNRIRVGACDLLWASGLGTAVRRLDRICAARSTRLVEVEPERGDGPVVGPRSWDGGTERNTSRRERRVHGASRCDSDAATRAVAIGGHLPTRGRSPESVWRLGLPRPGDTRGANTTVLHGHGVDSCRSWFFAVSALRYALKENGRSLVWLGPPGEVGVPLVIQEYDPDFIALVEHLLAAEHSRQALWRKQSRAKPEE